MIRLKALGGVLLAVAAIGCSGDSSPTQANNTPGLNLSGTWRGTLVETAYDKRTFDLTLTLAQSPGGSTVDGSVVTSLADFRSAGTISPGKQNGLTVELYATYVDEAGRQTAYNRYEGRANADGTAISGSAFNVVTGYNPSPFGTWSVRREP